MVEVWEIPSMGFWSARRPIMLSSVLQSSAADRAQTLYMTCIAVTNEQMKNECAKDIEMEMDERE